MLNDDLTPNTEIEEPASLLGLSLPAVVEATRWVALLSLGERLDEVGFLPLVPGHNPSLGTISPQIDKGFEVRL
ncbi:MAG: hypothetical protein NZ742_09865 [Acidobacteria bacterium]|nr:hypothetical protein [Acidobacteriota bacterium]MDW7985065.1 hypothetical protein [Acidobacteriota bacterium]